ncbi:MAG: hypothetical protein OSA93_05855 [Akkermansiaceae bacterium]|nr:hypothetical protein [Akkermansiaceae bacterium]
MPSKGKSAMGPGMIGTVAVLASLTTPVVMKAKTNANKNKKINKMKLSFSKRIDRSRP